VTVIVPRLGRVPQSLLVAQQRVGVRDAPWPRRDGPSRVRFIVRRTSRPGDRVETVFIVLAEESPGSTGQGGCQRQPGVTRGTVPQRTDRRFLREPVRVKRRCKRPPAFRVTGTARQTPPGARSRRARAGDRTNPRRRSRVARPMPAGGPLEPAGDGRPRWMVAT